MYIFNSLITAFLALICQVCCFCLFCFKCATFLKKIFLYIKGKATSELATGLVTYSRQPTTAHLPCAANENPGPWVQQSASCQVVPATAVPSTCRRQVLVHRQALGNLKCEEHRALPSRDGTQNLFSAQKAEADVLPSLLTLCVAWDFLTTDSSPPEHCKLAFLSQSVKAILTEGVPLHFSEEFQCSYVQFSLKKVYVCLLCVQDGAGYHQKSSLNYDVLKHAKTNHSKSDSKVWTNTGYWVNGRPDFFLWSALCRPMKARDTHF